MGLDKYLVIIADHNIIVYFIGNILIISGEIQQNLFVKLNISSQILHSPVSID
ncbi:hypothetical protein SDC9_189321 [bioreactor metagenome]|uniref:Uncharacterized protein n=1 Tax=bioreactor metagenome TaxID=1076179 RepID=A0A645HT70_9ZZZZ